MSERDRKRDREEEERERESCDVMEGCGMGAREEGECIVGDQGLTQGQPIRYGRDCTECHVTRYFM